MATRDLTLARIREKGFAALLKALGPVGMIRFLHQLDVGSGDYTQERKRLQADLTVDEVAEGVRELRRKSVRGKG